MMTELHVPVSIGYVRLSRDDDKSLSIENQSAALRSLAPDLTIVVDKGVSGETNLTDPRSAWSREVQPLVDARARIHLYLKDLDRLGRRKGKLLSVIEDILDAGGTITTERTGRTFTQAKDLSQAIELLFTSLTAEQYREAVRAKTQTAMDALKSHGIQLGRKPALTDKDAKEIFRLRDLGLGVVTISKVTAHKVEGKDYLSRTSPKAIRAVLDGAYLTREKWEEANARARAAMKGEDS